MATVEGEYPILDRDWLEGLVSDDASILAELLALFEGQAATLVGVLGVEDGGGDGKMLREAAHKLKGSAASLGLRSLSCQLGELEELLDGGEASQGVVGERCGEIRQGLDCAMRELREYVELRTKNE